MWILDLLGLKESGASPSAAANTDSVRAIVAALDALPPERARTIAAYAYLLARVARADLEISPVETREMERLVAARAGLPEAQAVLAVQIAKTQSLFGGTENFLVTRELATIASEEDKLGMIDCLFAVAAANGAVSVAEENEIRRITNELQLGHADYIAVRSRYRDQLAVLRRPPAPD